MKQLGQFRLKKEFKVLSHWISVNVYYEHAASKHRPKLKIYLKNNMQVTWVGCIDVSIRPVVMIWTLHSLREEWLSNIRLEKEIDFSNKFI